MAHTGREIDDERQAKTYADEASEAAARGSYSSLFTGQLFKSLATYLQQPYEGAQHAAQTHDSESGVTFASLQRFLPDLIEQPVPLSDIASFDEETVGWSERDNASFMLFLRGHPSPKWLNAIGSRFNIDLRFFNNHLDFRISGGKRELFATPELPSAANTIARLCITTIASRSEESASRKRNSAVKADRLRARNEEIMSSYVSDLKKNQDGVTKEQIALGESIVRHVSTHDEETFSIEQDVSICLSPSKHGWLAIIWLDHGSDLGWSTANAPIVTCLTSAGQRLKTTYLPTVQHMPGKTAIDRKMSTSEAQSLDERVVSLDERVVPQTAALLPMAYGAHLDPPTALRDSSYALSELLTFAASSENQYLNLLKYKIAQEIHPDTLKREENPSLTNLLYSKQLLERHVRRLEDNIRSLNTSDTSCWPRRQGAHTDPEAQSRSDTARHKYLEDFNFLLDYARNLATRSDHGMQVVMQEAMLRESHRAIEQGALVGRLALLAYIYVPFTFAAGVFGMNFAELGQGHVHVWWFFAVAIPIAALSVAVMKVNLATWWSKVHRKGQRRTTTTGDLELLGYRAPSMSK